MENSVLIFKMKYLDGNKDTWIKGKSYQKRILLDNASKNLNIIEDVIVHPHGEIPAHAHNHTNEIFYIVSGKAIMIVENKEFEIKHRDTIFIDKKESHGFRNESDEELKMYVLKLDYEKGDSYLPGGKKLTFLDLLF